MTSLATPTTKRLPHLCEGVLTYGLGLRRAKDPGSAEQVRQHMSGMLAEIDQQAAAAGFAAADVQAAKYALVAYIDEIILSSHWDIRQEWASRPLQLEYFNDFTAGEEFYNKLHAARAQGGPHGLDLVEVYSLCLGLGFKGKNADLAGMERLKVLSSELNREIQTGRGVDPSTLSTNVTVEHRLQEKVKNLPVWVMASIAVGGLLLVFLLFDLLLGSRMDELERVLEAPASQTPENPK